MPRLGTFKRNGQAVPTSVWFVADEDDLLFVRSYTNSGKAKRKG